MTLLWRLPRGAITSRDRKEHIRGRKIPWPSRTSVRFYALGILGRNN